MGNRDRGRDPQEYSLKVKSTGISDGLRVEVKKGKKSSGIPWSQMRKAGGWICWSSSGLCRSEMSSRGIKATSPREPEDVPERSCRESGIVGFLFKARRQILFQGNTEELQEVAGH